MPSRPDRVRKNYDDRAQAKESKKAPERPPDKRPRCSEKAISDIPVAIHDLSDIYVGYLDRPPFEEVRVHFASWKITPTVWR